MKSKINGIGFTKAFVFLCAALFLSGLNLNAQETGDFKPSGKIWGYIFGDVLFKVEGDTLNFGRSEFAKEEKNALGGKLRRVYFGYDYNLSERWFVRFLLEGNSGVITDKGEFTTKIKLGYLQYKILNNPTFHNAKINVGLIPTPIFAFPEKEWGYRSVEKEALDVRGFGSSVDQGISFESNFTAEGTSGFKVMVGNGSGSKPILNKNLQYHASIFTSVLDNKLKLEAFANYIKDANGLNKTVTRGFASYSVSNFRLGIEASQNFFEEFGLVNGVTEVKQTQPFLLSTYASTRLKEDIWVFLRYDYFNPDSDYRSDFVYSNVAQNYDEQLLIAGIQFVIHNKLNHNIQIMPNVHINSYEPKQATFVDRKPDIVLRTTLYYNF